MDAKRSVKQLPNPALIVAAALSLLSGCAKNNQYECIERSENEVPNYQAAGTHTEVEYVLLHNGDKIYASCDVSDLSNLDPDARCGLRPLRTYECTVQPAGIEKQKFPLSDLKCKDGDGHNVYLYVSKNESVSRQGNSVGVARLKICLLWLSAVSGIIAAILWLLATWVKVDYKRIPKKDGTFEPAITEDENGGREIDVLRTAKKQTLWNRWAALFTGISMFAQAISLML